MNLRHWKTRQCTSFQNDLYSFSFENRLSFIIVYYYRFQSGILWILILCFESDSYKHLSISTPGECPSRQCVGGFLEGIKDDCVDSSARDKV